MFLAWYAAGSNYDNGSCWSVREDLEPECAAAEMGQLGSGSMNRDADDRRGQSSALVKGSLGRLTKQSYPP